jgi:exodeoxyribonuclease VII small subunit
MGRSSATPDELSFEAALERLEGIVDRLESGELALEDALKSFEEGVALSRRCAGQLEAAERRIEILVRDGAGVRSEAFVPAPDELDEDPER